MGALLSALQGVSDSLAQGANIYGEASRVRNEYEMLKRYGTTDPTQVAAIRAEKEAEKLRLERLRQEKLEADRLRLKEEREYKLAQAKEAREAKREQTQALLTAFKELRSGPDFVTPKQVVAPQQVVRPISGPVYGPLPQDEAEAQPRFIGPVGPVSQVIQPRYSKAEEAEGGGLGIFALGAAALLLS